MNENGITVNSYAKINLALDVLGKREDGYHLVDMVMQQVDLHDEVSIRWFPDDAGGAGVGTCNGGDVTDGRKAHYEGIDVGACSGDGSAGSDGGEINGGDRCTVGRSCVRIELKTNKHFLPTDQRNIAYKAARLMAERFAPSAGKIRIDIKKQIPVAAGLAGGSGNGAAVLHGLSYLWRLELSLGELCALGAELGADVPFCVMGQAGADPRLGIEAAACCARATGTGTDLEPLPSVDGWLVLTKPPISVSTAEVYRGIDREEVRQRPNTAVLIEGIYANNIEKITRNMINVLELFTLKMYPSVMYTKNKVLEQSAPLKVLMSGSGPTIFALYKNKADAEAAFAVLKQDNKETYLAHTVMPK